LPHNPVKNSGFDPASLPRKYQDQIAGQLGAPKPATKAPEGLKIKQSHKKGSKLQTDFVAYLTAGVKIPGVIILEEAINLEIANGCRYRPDAWTVRWYVLNGEPVLSVLEAYEVKGPHAWDDSIVKLKVAARSFPWIKFFLATRKGRFGEWKIVRVEA